MAISTKKNIFILSFLWLSMLGLQAQSVGGTTSGAATYCSTPNSGFVSVTGYTGTIIDWQSSINSGTSWTSTGNTSPNQSYFALTQTTCYRAIVKNGAFPADTSTVVCITVFAPTAGGSITGAGTFCSSSGIGTLTLTGNTGNVLNWQSSTNGGTTWTTISNTTTTLNFSGITQNTLYEAVVQNSPLCAIDTSATANFIIDSPSIAGSISLAGNDTVCYATKGDTLTLSGYTGNVVSWISSVNSGSSWSLISNNNDTLVLPKLFQSTLYTVIVKNGVCPNDTAAYSSITVVTPAPAHASNDTTILLGQSATVSGSGIGTPVWLPTADFSNATSFSTLVTPTVLGANLYLLTVTDSNSCVSIDTIIITANPPVFTGMVSNYFSPNGDGINDNWYIQDILIFPKNEVFVYNIYGNQVYTKQGYANDWKGTYNGSDLPDGTYYYVLKFDDSDKTIKGSVDILRKK